MTESTAYEFLSVTCADRVTTLMLNRPESMNALNPALHEELERARDAFAADAGQCVCVITGAGPRAFCAGSDLKIAAAQDSFGTYPAHGYAGIVERFDLDKPVIAAVNGVAMGGGFELALACDLIIAADTARFGLPEPRVGAVALGGGVHRLARQIGMKAAMGMVLTARPVTAQEGLALGFVNEVVPAAELETATRCWIDQILACSPIAIEASKQTLLRGLDEPSLADALRNQAGYPKFAAWLASDDKREGPRAFAEKRAPRWRS